MNIARISLVAAMLFGGCHPLPSIAGEANPTIRESAIETCKIAGVHDSEDCIEIIGGEYYDAIMIGGHDSLNGDTKRDPRHAVSLGFIITQCTPQFSIICKEHVINWAAWYMWGQRTVLKDKTLKQDVISYYK